MQQGPLDLGKWNVRKGRIRKLGHKWSQTKDSETSKVKRAGCGERKGSNRTITTLLSQEKCLAKPDWIHFLFARFKIVSMEREEKNVLTSHLFINAFPFVLPQTKKKNVNKCQAHELHTQE